MAGLLAIGAHPDDETMLAGGTLAWAARNGLTVHILGVTRGEGGEVGDPPVTTRDQLGATREAELRRAGEHLGAASVEFLPFADPQMMPTDEDPAPPTALGRIAAEADEFEAALVAAIRRLRPDVLLTHGTNGEYGHPQHIFTHQAVLAAVQALAEPRPELLTWCAAHDGAPDAPAEWG